MMKYDVRGRLPLILVFAIFLLVPSFDTALKYFGAVGVVVYFFTGTLFLLLLDRFALPIFFSTISDKAADYLATAMFVLLAAAAMYLGPIANSGRFGGGSDADDALLIAANELANGRFPYYVVTYLGNQIGPMPGSILFAMPFSLTGTIQLQNVVWLAVFYLAVRYFEKSSATALGLVWILLVLSPTVLQNIATGADYVSNTIFVLVFMWMLVRSASSNTSAIVSNGVIAAILLGIALSSRSTFFLLMPLLLSVLVQVSGWSNSIKYLSISAIAFLVVTVPFWLYDPSGFAPLHVQGAKLAAVESVLRFAAVIVPVSAGALSIILSFQTMRNDCTRFFLNCAIVQMFVLIFTSVLYTLKLQRLDLFVAQSGYGMFTLFFGVSAAWMYLYRYTAVTRDQDFVEA